MDSISSSSTSLEPSDQDDATVQGLHFGSDDDDDAESFHYPGTNADHGDSANADASYSSTMEELLADDDDEDDVRPRLEGNQEEEEEEEESGFLYTGADAVDTKLDFKGYRNRLRDVLSDDEDLKDDEEDFEEDHREQEPDTGALPDSIPNDSLDDDQPLPEPSFSSPETPSRELSPAPHTSWYSETPERISSPFLHPTVSRLRSFTPQSSRVSSLAGSGTPRSHSNLFEGGSTGQGQGFMSPSPSHFSAISSTSSIHSGFGGHDYGAGSSSNANGKGKQLNGRGSTSQEREVFRWTSLRNIGNYIYSQGAQKAASILGSPTLGRPTALAANGLICVGTDQGRVVVYDFKQTLKCVCGAPGSDSSEKPKSKASAAFLGPVTALALSHDHTFVAAGHSTGHIQIYDLKSPNTPARFVPPTTLQSVLSGRKEGHLEGSRIVNIGFVAGRHTAIVSADEHGLAFYHSLGKVLFVDAVDIVRVLGMYPEFETPPPAPQTASGSKQKKPPSQKLNIIRKPRHRVLAMQPLPLGTASHPTDGYNLTALLTPTKLVLVGMKPTPRTWFKRARDPLEEQGGGPDARMLGTLVWYPSVFVQSDEDELGSEKLRTEGSTSHVPSSKGQAQSQVIPTLAYSWGDTFNVLRVSEAKVKQSVKNARTEKVVQVDVGRIECAEVGRWKAAGGAIVAMQWLNANQLLLVTKSSIELFDLSTFKTVESTPFDMNWLQPISQIAPGETNGSVPVSYDLAHSVRIYKGKIFMLGRDDLRVGSLLTWADRILTYVESGSFLSAINLTLSYYLGTAPGNLNNLPISLASRQILLGQKIRELMVASVSYAFSEDRMHDATHWSADGRGVDRTELFEEMVATCTKACIALDDFDFLYEDLFSQYDDVGIARIYLLQLEKFILEGSLSYVPPRITQRLLDLLEGDRRPDLVEKIIWHIDPLCLDLNRAVGVCRREGLYDALVYVYTRGLRDWVGPIVEFIGLIRKVRTYRESRLTSKGKGKGKERSRAGVLGIEGDVDAAMESVIINAYKIYPYIANVLSGLSYPSEEPLSTPEALQAKKDVFSFVFFGHSCVWPPGSDGKLVLTSDDEGVSEPTYPYTRLLLQFDPESFLHSLDIAFEDTYLNDELPNGRLLVVRIFLDILSSNELPPAYATFIRIFIARNVPKYTQFLSTVLPTQLHSILVGLAQDSDESTREDRQLATEFLLSVYTPQDSEVIQSLFEEAGFWRILRSWHRQDRHWPALVTAFVSDRELGATDVFVGINDTLGNANKANATLGALPDELVLAISDALPRLLQISPGDTAILVDNHSPSLHDEALQNLAGEDDSVQQQYRYLQYLLLHLSLDSSHEAILRPPSSPRLLDRHRQLFVSLQCQINPSQVVEVLRSFDPSPLDDKASDGPDFDWKEAVQNCEAHAVYDAVVWSLDWHGEPLGALDKAEQFEKSLTLDLVKLFDAEEALSSEQEEDVSKALETLQTIGSVAVQICLRRSEPAMVASSNMEVSLEDIWFKLLSSQINCVQNVSACCVAPTTASSSTTSQHALSTLRSLVQTTFTSLVSISSGQALSFPRLFKRLIDPSSHSSTPEGSQYSEFRVILTGMLESYRSDEDILHITKRLIDRDVFNVIEEHHVERAKGWRPSRMTCAQCRTSFLDGAKRGRGSPQSGLEGGSEVEDRGIVISRTGAIYHRSCQPNP